MPSQVAIQGNTYPVKEQLKAMGARWNADQKAWMVSADKADAARKIVAGTSTSATPAKTAYRPQKCSECGKAARFDSRGYPIGDRILRSGECQSCYEERKMGY